MAMTISRFFRSSHSTVGLDIGSSTVKLAKITHRKDGLFLNAIGIQELPAGTIEGAEIKNKAALMHSLSTLISQCDPSIVEVVISMSGSCIISDRMHFQVDANENAEELILWQASQRSPFDGEDITLDYKVLQRDEKTGELEVFVVGAKKQIMQVYIDLLYDIGLKPAIVDVDSLAMTNCYGLTCGEGHEKGTVALINIGHSLTNVTFIKDGIYHSNRDIATAGAYFNTILQRNLAVSIEEANAILKGRTHRALDMDSLWQSMDYAAEELSSGIDLAFSYFANSENGDSVDKIVLCGGGAYIPNIIPFLEKRHHATVQLINPLAYLQYEPGLFGSTNPLNIGAVMTIALGLALRKNEL
jgi:type IV pilus assembly protein PilM